MEISEVAEVMAGDAEPIEADKTIIQIQINAHNKIKIKGTLKNLTKEAKGPVPTSPTTRAVAIGHKVVMRPIVPTPSFAAGPTSSSRDLKQIIIIERSAS